METITASHVENSGLRAETLTAGQQTPRFEPLADCVGDAEPLRAEIKSVIGGRVYAVQLGLGGAWIEVDKPAVSAADGKKRVGARPVLEILADRYRIGVAALADAALRRDEPKGSSWLNLGALQHQLLRFT